MLFALNSLREAEIGLLATRRDSYVARAAVLRRTGRLDVTRLLAEPVVYDPAGYTRRVRRRGAVPWGGALRELDRLTAPRARSMPAETLAPASPIPAGPDSPALPPVEVTTRVNGLSSVPGTRP